MKTERRHELQTNALADWLGKQIEGVRPYSKLLLGGLILAAVAIFALRFMSAQRSGRVGQGWQEFYAASLDSGLERADQLLTIAENHAGTTLGLWARQAAADAFLAQGTSLLRTDPDDAANQLKQALDAYRYVAENSDNELLQPRALFGLAQTHEARNEIDKAKQQYERIIDGWPDSALAAEARDRMQFIDDASTREFLAWYDKQEPTLPPPGTLPEGFDFSAPGGSGGPPSQSNLPFGTLEFPSSDDRPGGQDDRSDQTAPDSGAFELFEPKLDDGPSDAADDGDQVPPTISDLEPAQPPQDAPAAEATPADAAPDNAGTEDVGTGDTETDDTGVEDAGGDDAGGDDAVQTESNQGSL
jgi:hypothetical protein